MIPNYSNIPVHVQWDRDQEIAEASLALATTVIEAMIAPIVPCDRGHFLLKNQFTKTEALPAACFWVGHP
jgi:hypothetical protein